MERITIKAQKRDKSGKGAARTLRSESVIPAVLYRGGSATPIKIQKAELSRFIHQTRGEQVMVNLSFPDGESRVAIVKDIQVDPIKRELLHTDFFEVSLTEEVKVTVAVHIVGEPLGVKRDGAVLEYGLGEIEVQCLPDNIPGHVDVDVSPLVAGQSVHVADLKLPAGVKVLTAPKEVIAIVAAPKIEVAAPAAVEETAEPEVIKKGKAEEEGEGEAQGEKKPEKKEEKKPGKEEKKEAKK